MSKYSPLPHSPSLNGQIYTKARCRAYSAKKNIGNYSNHACDDHYHTDIIFGGGGEIAEKFHYICLHNIMIIKQFVSNTDSVCRDLIFYYLRKYNRSHGGGPLCMNVPK